MKNCMYCGIQTYNTVQLAEWVKHADTCPIPYIHELQADNAQQQRTLDLLGKVLRSASETLRDLGKTEMADDLTETLALHGLDE